MSQTTDLLKSASIQNIFGLKLFILTIITICDDGCSILMIGIQGNMHLKAETCGKIITNFAFFCIAKLSKNDNKIW